MPDTKISRQPQGWIDTENPNIFYRVRREARAARRDALIKAGKLKQKPQKHAPKKRSGTTVTVLGLRNAMTNVPNGQVVLSGLQQKLYNRLTGKQGVDADDALEIVTTNPYNKAASYGHMRAAGASHPEAAIVISLGSPEISIAYGKTRATGVSHTGALVEALKSKADA